MRYDWTDETVAALGRMWTDEGMTFEAIAAVLGVSRATVAGKVRRLGLNGHGAREAKGGWHSQTRNSRGARASVVFPEKGGCLWADGDPRARGFTFCGAPSAAGRVYCADHAARVYLRPANGNKSFVEPRAAGF